MLARNWKHQWLPLSFARQARRVSMCGFVVNPMRSNQNLRVSWKPVNLQDCVWENLYRIIMKTKLQEKGTIHCIITICYTNYSYAPSHENSAAKAAVDKEWEKLEKILAWDLTKVRSKSAVIDEARTKVSKVHFCLTDGHLSVEECRIGGKPPKIRRSSCISKRHCER